jgi:ABC-type Fe3+ transport system substrate-binding protein
MEGSDRHAVTAQFRTAIMIHMLFGLYGEEEGWKFLAALDKNIHHYTRSGNAPTDLVYVNFC